MGTVINFPDVGAVKFVKASDRLDAAVLEALDSGLEPYEVAALIAHCLGRVLKMEGDSVQLEFCLGVTRDIALRE